MRLFQINGEDYYAAADEREAVDLYAAEVLMKPEELDAVECDPHKVTGWKDEPPSEWYKMDGKRRALNRAIEILEEHYAQTFVVQILKNKSAEIDEQMHDLYRRNSNTAASVMAGMNGPGVVLTSNY